MCRVITFSCKSSPIDDAAKAPMANRRSPRSRYKRYADPTSVARTKKSRIVILHLWDDDTRAASTDKKAALRKRERVWFPGRRFAHTPERVACCGTCAQPRDLPGGAKCAQVAQWTARAAVLVSCADRFHADQEPLAVPGMPSDVVSQRGSRGGVSCVRRHEARWDARAVPCRHGAHRAGPGRLVPSTGTPRRGPCRVRSRRQPREGADRGRGRPPP